MNKQTLRGSLASGLLSTSEWRAHTQTVYKNDPRNERAAAKLQELAEYVSGANDSEIREFEPYFVQNGPTWRKAVSSANRAVSFRNEVATFSEYAEILLARLVHS